MKQQEWNSRKEKYRKILRREKEWEEAATAVCRLTGEETACYVLAPVLCHYVAWIVKMALQTAKKRIYFLARDGYQMYNIAQIFCKELSLPVECRYLYCSRYALRKAECRLVPEQMYHYLCLDGLNVTMETVFCRAGIREKEEQQKYADLLGMQDLLSRTQEDRQLSYQELQNLKSRLQACELFDEHQKQRAERAYENAIGYFKQEGLLDKETCLLADSGWSGTLQQTIGRLLGSAGQKTVPEGCYFGLYEFPETADRSRYYTWFFSPEDELNRKMHFNNNVFECICTSPEGMCVGYKMDEKGIYRPRLSATESPNRELSLKLKRVFTEYAGYMAEEHPEKLRKLIIGEKIAGSTEDNFKPFLKTAEQMLALFMGAPTQKEAELYGSFAFCDDVIGEENRYLAAALEKKEIRQNHLFGQLRRRLLPIGREYTAARETDASDGRNSAWMEASIALAYPEQERGRSLVTAVRYKKELWHCRNVKWVRYARKQRKAKQKRGDCFESNKEKLTDETVSVCHKRTYRKGN